MTLDTLLATARDVTALFVVCAIGLTAAVALSGAAGLSGGLAASLVVIGLAGVATFALHGLILAVATSGVAVGVFATAALLIGAAFLATHQYGARGLWLAALAAVGAALAWGLIAATQRGSGAAVATLLGLGPPDSARAMAITAAAPAFLLAVFALLAFGALAAAHRAAQNGAATNTEMVASGPTRLGEGARLAFAAPPAWFDCLYATLGGAARDPALCVFTPPTVESDPQWARSEAPPPADPALAAAARAPDEPGDAAVARVPASLTMPADPAVETPAFAPLDPAEGAPPPSETASISAPASPDAAGPPDVSQEARVSDTPEGAPEADATAPTTLSTPPLAASLAPEADSQADAQAGGGAAAEIGDTAPQPIEAPPGVSVADMGDLVQPTADGAVALASAGLGERRRSEFVCFSMMTVEPERLCRDQALSLADFSVTWREPGGEATAPPESVECFYDPRLPLHASLFVHLSGELAEPMARAAAADAARIRKADAIYEMVTRLVGGVRASAADRGAQGAEALAEDRLDLSLHIANGSDLLSPWAAQDFGRDRRDPIFNLRSSGQTLALLRRLKTETQAVRRGADGPPLAETLEAALASRPAAPAWRTEAAGSGRQGAFIVVADAAAAETLSEEEAARLAGAFRAAGAPIVFLVVGAVERPAGAQRLAADTGGVSAATASLDGLSDALSAALERLRSFCALKVTAPESFFDAGEFEISLRRRLTDGCVAEQIAVRRCDGLEMRERLIVAD